MLLSEVNTRGQPRLSGDIPDQVMEAFQDRQYVTQSVWGPWEDTSEYWNDTPMNFYRLGGRGSTQYSGPAGLAAMLAFSHAQGQK